MRQLFNYVLIAILSMVLISCGDDADNIFNHDNYQAAKKTSLTYITAVSNNNIDAAANLVYASANQADIVRAKVEILALEIKQKTETNDGIKAITSQKTNTFVDEYNHKRAKSWIEISFNQADSLPFQLTVDLIKYGNQWQIKLLDN